MNFQGAVINFHSDTHVTEWAGVDHKFLFLIQWAKQPQLKQWILVANLEWACEKGLTAIRYGLNQFGGAKLYSVLCLVRYPPASPSGVEFIYEFLSLSLALCLCQNFSNPLVRRQQGPVAFFRRYNRYSFFSYKNKGTCLSSTKS